MKSTTNTMNRDDLRQRVKRQLDDYRPLLERFNVSGPRYTSYPTAPHFSDSYAAAEHRETLLQTNVNDPGKPLSLYVHLPFCSERCTFCGCYVIISPDKKVRNPYLDHLHQEIDLVGSMIAQGRTCEQFHFGGGTPTYLTPEELEEIFLHVKKYVTFTDSTELAIEIDPRETTQAHLEKLTDLGFNRFSMGVQDFAEPVQIAVNRLQSYDMTADNIRYLRSRGVRYINLDLIYGLPFQTPESFIDTIEKVLTLEPTRLAVYSYAHVPWMKGHQKQFTELDLPQGEAKFELFLLARELFVNAGYKAIGFDHFALPEDELTIALENRTLQRNFMGFTTKAGTDLYGLGVSAISSVGSVYAQNLKKLKPYYAAVEAGDLPTERGLRLTRDDEIRRSLIMQIFCNYHLDIPEFEKAWGLDFHEYFSQEIPKLKEFTDLELLRFTDAELFVTERGHHLVRNICMVFDAYYVPAGSAQKYSKTI